MAKESFVYSLFGRKKQHQQTSLDKGPKDVSRLGNDWNTSFAMKHVAPKSSIYAPAGAAPPMAESGIDQQQNKAPKCKWMVGAPQEIVSSFGKLSPIGEGTYGVVYKAVHIPTGQLVALKKIRLTSGESNEQLASTGVSTTAVREIMLLRELRHPNIVELQDVHYSPPPRLQLWLVFEYCVIDLRQYVKAVSKIRKSMSPGIEVTAAQKVHSSSLSHGLPIEECQRFIEHILKGILFIHSLNILHRDLKPQNVLLKLPDWNEVTGRADSDLMKSGLNQNTAAGTVHKYWDITVAKIADLGLARSCKAPKEQLTQEVVTLWYRAPELLLGTQNYDKSIDMWSVGCILVEMLIGKPLFQGDSEIDTLFKIFQLMGTPSANVWPDGRNLPYYQHCFPKWERNRLTSLSDLLFCNKYTKPPAVTNLPSSPTATSSAEHHDALILDLVERCLRYKPSERITAAEALKHPWLRAELASPSSL